MNASGELVEVLVNRRAAWLLSYNRTGWFFTGNSDATLLFYIGLIFEVLLSPTPQISIHCILRRFKTPFNLPSRS